jgi:hypothetical protein
MNPQAKEELEAALRRRRAALESARERQLSIEQYLADQKAIVARLTSRVRGIEEALNG